MKHAILSAMIATFLLGCTKQEEEFLISNFYDCEQPKRTAAELTSVLVGQWELREISCGLCSGKFPKKVKEEEKTLLNFYPDNSLTVTDSNSQQVFEKGQWEIVLESTDAYVDFSVEGGSSVSLPGGISICNNQLYSDLTYIDLLGFLYVKLD